MKFVKKTSLMICVMLFASLFAGLGLVQLTSAATILVPSEELTIQKAINNASSGDTIVVDDGFYVENLVVNQSVTIKSANGTSATWINGTVNITVNATQIGDTNAGFTICQSTITEGTNAVDIGTNGTRDDVTVRDCLIIGGFDGIHIGQTGASSNEATNITIYNNIIENCGGSAINVSPAFLRFSMIFSNRGFNTSNTATAAIFQFDGGYSNTIQLNTMYDTRTNGGEGINFTGCSHPVDDVDLYANTISLTDGYSPIIIRSLTDSEYVQNMRITFNELTNDSNGLAEPALRFDNISGMITATNISVFFNNMSTSSRDIEERFALTATYDNWTGVMPAYFNWYDNASGGTFRYSSHLHATPCLIAANAYDDIITSGTLELTGAESGYVNNTYYADTNVSGTSTDDLIVVVYSYPVSLLTTYPTRSMHKYVEIGLSDYTHVDYPANITIYYTSADLETRGWSERHIRGLVYYNDTSGEWEQFNNTGCNTDDTWGSYEGYVWANVYSGMGGTIIGIDYNEIVTDEEEEGGGGGGTGGQQDTDGDGLPDTFEQQIGTDPTKADTDGDGYDDRTEYLAGGAIMALDANSTPSALPTFFGQSILIWVVIIIVLAVIIVLLILLMNPKIRRKWFS